MSKNKLRKLEGVDFIRKKIILISAMFCKEKRGVYG